MRTPFRSFAAGLLFAGLVAGCTSFEVSQTSHFTDDNGNIITVEYGSGKEEHVTTFTSPANGKKMEMRSRLRVRVQLPDETKFMAFQCMNFQRSGTMYRTDDEEWLFHANGFTSRVYRFDPSKNDYLLWYEGVICQSPMGAMKRGEKGVRR